MYPVKESFFPQAQSTSSCVNRNNRMAIDKSSNRIKSNKCSIKKSAIGFAQTHWRKYSNK